MQYLFCEFTMNSSSFTRIKPNNTISYANYRIMIHYRFGAFNINSLSFRKLAVDPLSILRIQNGSIIFIVNSLLINYLDSNAIILFRKIILNLLSILRIYYKSIIMFAKTRFYAKSLWSHNLLREYILN